MNVTYVTALYSLYQTPNVAQRLMRDVKVLLDQSLPLIVFVDEIFEPLIRALTLPSTVRIIPLPMSQLTIYNMIVANKTLVGLPPQRDKNKDTHEYIALMNSKIEFLQRAIPYVDTPLVAWIDAGVAKMVKEPDATFQSLRSAHLHNITTTLFPGCYEREVDFESLQRSVWWVFMGTFFVANVNYVSTLYNLSLQALARFLLNGIVPWEVNVWIEMRKHNPEAFRWYYSDHDDGFAKFPPQ